MLKELFHDPEDELLDVFPSLSLDERDVLLELLELEVPSLLDELLVPSELLELLELEVPTELLDELLEPNELLELLSIELLELLY